VLVIETRIRHWHNRYRAQQPLSADVYRQWDESLAHLDVDTALAELVARDEWVLIRTLPLSARWRTEDGPAQAGAAWGQSLAQSLRRALEHEGPNVVRYRDGRAAVADMLYHAALGDTTRCWAWQQMGLIGAAEASAPELLAAAVRAMVAEPTEIWPALMRLLQADAATGAWTGLMRTLSTPAWQELLLTAPQTRPFALAATTATPGTVLPDLDSTAAALLLAWARSQPLLARRQAEALAVLLAVMSRPVASAVPSARPPTLAQLTAAARQLVAGLLSGHTSALRREATHNAHDAEQQELTPAQAEQRRQERREQADAATDELPPLPALPEVAKWRATEWGGLLFLLRLLPASGALDALPGAAEIPLFLWRLATRLQVPLTDPALWAFCGDWQPGAAELNAEPDNWAELDALAARVASDWAEWLATHLPDVPAPRLEAVCRRSGRIRFEAGWIELHLPLDAADVRLRRAALDLDPGWLPWLGCVVRICYD
jgi:hypothetical protein